MLKDITIGQYFPGNSPLHRMDSRMKLVLTVVFIVMLFVAKNKFSLFVGIVFTLITYLISNIPFKMILKSLKPILPIIIFTSVLNLFFIRSGDILWQWKFLKITEDGFNLAVFMTVRIVCLIIGSSLLTIPLHP